MIRLSSSDFIGIASNQPIPKDSVIHAYVAGDITVNFTNDVRYVDQTIGTADGVTTIFTIPNAPIASGTLSVYLNATLQDGITYKIDVIEGTDMTVDYTTGLITFTQVPAGGLVITADYVGETNTSKTIPASVGDDIVPLNGAVSVTSVGTIGIHSL